jgi:hypothetical protein
MIDAPPSPNDRMGAGRLVPRGRGEGVGA